MDVLWFWSDFKRIDRVWFLSFFLEESSMSADYFDKGWWVCVFSQERLMLLRNLENSRGKGTGWCVKGDRILITFDLVTFISSLALLRTFLSFLVMYVRKEYPFCKLSSYCQSSRKNVTLFALTFSLSYLQCDRTYRFRKRRYYIFSSDWMSQECFLHDILAEP